MITKTRLIPSQQFLTATALLLAALLSSIATAATITAGQLVNIRVGDGVSAPLSSGSQVRLDVYDVTYTGLVPTSVSLSQTIVLPSATLASGMTPPASGDRWLVQGGTAAGEGGLTLSTNGQYMALGGYNSCYAAGVTTSCLTNGTGNSGQRVVGLLDLSTGIVDTKTDYADAAVGSAIRNAFTTNGTDIWTANSTAGVRYVVSGGSTSVALTGTGGERRAYVYNGQLYTSRMSAGPPVVFGPATVGSGTPTSGAQTVTGLPGFTVTTNSIYDYFFADANTLYVVDDRNSASGGLEKWTFNGSTWSMVYNKAASGGTTGLKSLAGMVDSSGNVTLFAASVGTGANKLFGYTDTLANTSAASVTENLLVDGTAGIFGGTAANWNMRGVAIAPVIVPEPAAIMLLSIASFGLLSRTTRRV